MSTIRLLQLHLFDQIPRKGKKRSEIKKTPQPMLPEEDSMDEVEKAYKIMEEEGDVSRTLERPKQVKPRKKTRQAEA